MAEMWPYLLVHDDVLASSGIHYLSSFDSLMIEAQATVLQTSPWELLPYPTRLWHSA
jgi:hypothetical protein